MSRFHARRDDLWRDNFHVVVFLCRRSFRRKQPVARGHVDARFFACTCLKVHRVLLCVDLLELHEPLRRVVVHEQIRRHAHQHEVDLTQRHKQVDGAHDDRIH